MNRLGRLAWLGSLVVSAGCCEVYVVSGGGEGGSGGGLSDGGGGAGACSVVIAPSFGAEGISVSPENLELSWTLPIPIELGASATHLIRQSDGVEVELGFAPEGEERLRALPTSALRYFERYDLVVDEVTLPGGTICAGAASTFSTLRPEAEPRIPRPAPVTGLALTDDAIVTVSTNLPGLQVFSRDDVPSLLGELRTPGQPLGLAVLDGRAYVAMGTAGVLIVDLESPSGPTALGVAGTPGGARDVAIFEQNGSRLLAVADGREGLRIVDVTDPESPFDVGSRTFGSGAFAHRVARSGDRLALALDAAGLALLDISTPSSPELVAMRPSEAVAGTFGASRSVTDIALDGDLVFAGIGHYGTQTFSGDSLAFVEHLPGPDGACQVNCADRIADLVVADGRVWGAANITGAFSFAFSPDGQMSEPDTLEVGPYARSIALDATRVWVGADDGLHSFDRATREPVFSESRSHGLVRSLAMTASGALFGAAEGKGLLAFGEGPPFGEPEVSATPGVLRDYGPQAVAIHGDYAYLADGRAGLSVFSIDPSGAATPVAVVQGSPSTDLMSSIEFRENLAFVCDGNQAFRVFDISLPETPIALASLSINAEVGNCFQLTLHPTEPLAYVAGGTGLGVIDLSDPQNPTLIREIPRPVGEAISAARASSRGLYVTTTASDWEAGTDGQARRLVAFDLEDPADPQEVWASEDLGSLGQLTLASTKAFVAAGPEGVHIFDLSGDVPVYEGTIDLFGDALSTAVSGELLLVAARGAGVVLVPIGPIEGPL